MSERQEKFSHHENEKITLILIYVLSFPLHCRSHDPKEMCTGCCESMMSSSWRDATDFSSTSTILSPLYSFQDRRWRLFLYWFSEWLCCLAALPQATLCWAQILSYSGLLLIFTHLSYIFFKRNSSGLMSGAGKEFCKDLIPDGFHSK